MACLPETVVEFKFLRAGSRDPWGPGRAHQVNALESAQAIVAGGPFTCHRGLLEQAVWAPWPLHGSLPPVAPQPLSVFLPPSPVAASNPREVPRLPDGA